MFTPPDPDTGSPGGAYVAAERIREGLDEEMLDGAYARVQHVLAQGGSAILIAATNTQVEDLNMRATLDRRAAGLVTTARTTALRTGLAAGTGDVVLLRRTDRTVRDVDGVAVNNGDLIVVDDIRPDGTVHAHRQGLDGRRGAHLEVHSSWLAQYAELGYATTAHRAQGVTVSEGHLVITSTERLTRELLYVAMTRGRQTNLAWVGVMDEATARDAHVTISDVLTATDVLTRCLAAVGAEKTAHETGAEQAHSLHNLARLAAEHDYLGAVAGARALTAQLRELRGAGDLASIEASSSFDALVATWRRANAADPGLTRRLLAMPITPPEAPNTDGEDLGLDDITVNLAAILHQRLDRGVLAPADAAAPLDLDPLHAVLAPIPDVDPHLTALAQRCADLTRDRLYALADRIATTRHRPPHMPRRPTAPADLQQRWDTAALAAATYRDLWGEAVTAPAGDDERRRRHQARVLDLLRSWENPTPPRPPVHDIDPYADPDREWEETLAESWAPDIPEDTDATPPPEPEPAPVVPVAAAPVFAVREHTDYDTRLVTALEAAWELWQEQAPSSWVPGHMAERRLTLPAGYAPRNRDRTATLQTLRNRGFTTQELLDAGLATIGRGDKPIDRFADRLALPIRDARGRLLGFTARKDPGDDGPAPKYLNTSTTDLFAKSDVLYGLTPGAVDALNDGATPVLAEGALDVAAISELGRGWVPLATCGTALTPAHITTLDTLAPGSLDRLVLAFDPDAAGRKATARAWDFLPDTAITRVRAADLPGADPGELIQSGQAELLHMALTGAAPLREHLISAALVNTPSTSINQRVDLARALARFASRAGALEDAATQASLMLQLAHEMPEPLEADTLTQIVIDARDGARARPSTSASASPGGVSFRELQPATDVAASPGL